MSSNQLYHPAVSTHSPHKVLSLRPLVCAVDAAQVASCLIHCRNIMHGGEDIVAQTSAGGTRSPKANARSACVKYARSQQSNFKARNGQKALCLFLTQVFIKEGSQAT